MDVTVSIDHGKDFSRDTLVVIVHSKEDNEWNEKEELFLFTSARCRKENTEVIINTYGQSLNE